MLAHARSIASYLTIAKIWRSWLGKAKVVIFSKFTPVTGKRFLSKGYMTYLRFIRTLDVRERSDSSLLQIDLFGELMNVSSIVSLS